MMNSKKWAATGVALLSVLTLAACGQSAKPKSTSKIVGMPTKFSGQGNATTAGNNSTLKIAEVSDAPFAGIASTSLQSNAEDADVFSPGSGNMLFNVDANSKIIDGGLANMRLDRQAKTVTITLRKNAKWSNGAKVTAKDVEYPYEIIGSPDSPSTQYTNDLAAIAGMAEFHSGKAKTISGISFPDGETGRRVVIRYSKMVPAMQYLSSPFLLATVEPYAYLKKVAIADLMSAPQVRKRPLFTGPYKLAKVVQGESTSWVPNKYYWGKQAKIKHILIQVVSTSNVVAAFKAKKYDFAYNSPSSRYPALEKLKDYTAVGVPARAYGFYGFNVGHFDTKTGKNVTDANAKMNNKNLRQAMMYALDLDAVYRKFGNGISTRGNTLIPKTFKQYNDKNNPGFKYNLAKAKRLLDDAGYKKRSGDKWRTGPKGKPLAIHFAAAKGSAASDARAQYALQQWRKLGLNVQFTDGRLMDMNSFYSILQQPQQDQIDVYNAAWAVGNEPTPSAFYSENAALNLSHFVSKENTQLLEQMNDNSSWNTKKRIQVFYKWQKYMNDQAVYAPDNFYLDYSMVNERVKNYNKNPDANQFWSKLELTADKPL
jgi:peptide/nickel transport system substrate-binding protein